MKKPFKYIIICDKTQEVLYETNTAPLLHQLQTWEDTDNSKVKVLKQTRTVYENIRYEARLRLWNYVTFTRKGLEVPRYKPFTGTQTGKTEPILNF